MCADALKHGSCYPMSHNRVLLSCLPSRSAPLSHIRIYFCNPQVHEKFRGLGVGGYSWETELPESLRLAICRHLYKDLVLSIDLFDGTTAHVVRFIVTSAVPQISIPGELLQIRGDPSLKFCEFNLHAHTAPVGASMYQ